MATSRSGVITDATGFLSPVIAVAVAFADLRGEGGDLDHVAEAWVLTTGTKEGDRVVWENISKLKMNTIYLCKKINV